MADWIREGAADRSAARIAPTRHLLVETGDGWLLWCSGGKGHSQTPVLGNSRFCRECVRLANDAIADETLNPDDVQGWPVEVGTR